MPRDVKNALGLRKARRKDEQRLTRLLMGYQIAYLILPMSGCRVPKRWHDCFSSRPSLSVISLARHALDLYLKPGHRKVWRCHIWPAL
jgi:rhamnose utilization protein RhaD (predicted bifunctional aldolase and dehydrogenase)